MVEKNMGAWDRGIRIILGVVFIAISFLWSQLIFPLRVFSCAWGAVFLLTSSVGY